MKRRNIAIDCRPLQNRYAQRGIGTVVRNLLSHLVKSRYSGSIVLCGSTSRPPLLCEKYVKLKRPVSHDWIYEQILWPFDLYAVRAAIFHSTVSLGLIREIGFPLFSGIKSIATVYDLSPLRIPSLASHVKMKSFILQRMAVRRADRVITISEFVKKEIEEKLHIKEDRIRVIPCAVDEAIALAFDRFVPKAELQHEPFILAVGEGEHKNIKTVIAVFERLAAKGFQGTLRIVSLFDVQTETVKHAVRSSPYRDRIVFTGELTHEQLAANYALCRLLLLPSRLEGFGLPVIEAMYCGAPVVCSNTTALPEAGGNAAIYCDPDDIEGMVLVADRLLNDESFRRERIERGHMHARRRNWKHAAELVISIYEELGALIASSR